jgi:Zn-dependent metalloprotease
VDGIQAYLQRLGFTGTRGVNAHSQVINVNLLRDDNSFYDPNTDRISFGTGGVDDAEDLDVVWHEYGHAMQDDQVPGFGTSNQALALGEGFGDYMAMAMSQHSDALSGRTRTSPPYACIADWDATSYSQAPHCLRRTSLDLTMSDYDRWDIHWSGQIWSRALRDINAGLGTDAATRLIVEAQFAFAPGTSFRAAAQRTVEAATLLFPERPTVAEDVRRAFVRREIL